MGSAIGTKSMCVEHAKCAESRQLALSGAIGFLLRNMVHAEGTMAPLALLAHGTFSEVCGTDKPLASSGSYETC